MELERLIVVVIGRGRIQHSIAHFLAVDGQLVVADPRNVSAGALDREIERDDTAKNGEGDSLFRRKPFALPIGWVAQPHLEESGSAVIARLAIAVPDSDLPISPFA